MNDLNSRFGTILYVDDEPLACKYFKQTFQHDFSVLTASDVDEAFSILAHPLNRVQVVVTDFRMPKRTGDDLLVRVDQDYPHIVSILVSAYADKSMMLKAVNAGGAYKILEKPFDPDEMHETLRNAVLVAQRRLSHHQNRNTMADILGFLAHELNTPLASIVNYAGSILRNIEHPPLTTQTVEAINGCALGSYRNAQYTLKLLSTYLASLRAAGPALADNTRRTANDLVNTLLETFPLSIAQRACISAQCDDDFSIHSYTNSVALTLSSILSNALKAIENVQDPKITLTVSVGENPKIQVRDNGPGIPFEVSASLGSDPVAEAVNVSGGYGLVFCSRVMQSFGGSVQIQSSPGNTVVTLNFPADKHYKE